MSHAAGTVVTMRSALAGHRQPGRQFPDSSSARLHAAAIRASPGMHRAVLSYQGGSTSPHPRTGHHGLPAAGSRADGRRDRSGR